jgi:hypothetical protein
MLSLASIVGCSDSNTWVAVNDETTIHVESPKT